MAPSVAVIVRTRDEEGYIGETLKAVSGQSLPADEIIIVDSGSRDRTLQIVSRFNTETIKIAPSQFSYGGALNTGFGRAKSEILVSLSADATPVDKEWLSALVSPFEDPKTAGVYGRQIPRPGTNPSEKRDILARYGQKSMVQSRDYFFSNVNSAVKREVWEKVRFDETLPCAEDWDWAKRVQALGYMVRYEPRAAVAHSHNHTFAQAYGRARSVAYGGGFLDPSLRMSVANLLGEVIKETARDIGFMAATEPGFASPCRPFTYRLALALGRYQGLRHSMRASTVLRGRG